MFSLSPELNWNQPFRDRTKCKLCHQWLVLSTRLQNRSFYVVERTRTSEKTYKNENCTCKACRNIAFYCHICKFVIFLTRLSFCLLNEAPDFFPNGSHPGKLIFSLFSPHQSKACFTCNIFDNTSHRHNHGISTLHCRYKYSTMATLHHHYWHHNPC